MNTIFKTWKKATYFKGYFELRSDNIIQTDRNTEEFKQIQAVYNAYKAYLLTFKLKIRWKKNK